MNRYVDKLASDVANRVEAMVKSCETHNIECGQLKRMHLKLKQVNGDRRKLLQALVDIK